MNRFLTARVAPAFVAALMLCGGWSWWHAPTASATNPTVTQDSLTPTSAPAGSVTGTLQVHSSACFTVQALTIAVRDSGGGNQDYPDQFNKQICPSGYTYTGTKTFTAGTYTQFGAYEYNNVWTNLPTEALTITSGGGTGPDGPGGTWTQKFDDEFSGTTVDTTKWSFQSQAESDWSSSPLGTGNPNNQQLEFDQPGNCAVSGGVLNITQKPDSITSQHGTHYNWSSCMLNSSPAGGYNFQYGYIETSMKLPSVKGFWSSLWTWAHPGQNLGSANGETDAFENYSNVHSNFYLTQHTAPGGTDLWTAPFDPTTGYHTYGVDIEATGTTWWIDGAQVFSTAATSNGLTDINVDSFVYSGNGDTSKQPPAGTTEHTYVDYVRAWQH